MENFDEALAVSLYPRAALRMTKSPSRIVISSEVEKSFSFAVKWCVRVNGSGKFESRDEWPGIRSKR